MADDASKIIKDIALLSKYARMRYFGIGLEALRKKREHHDAAKRLGNISKALDLIKKDVGVQTKSIKAKGTNTKSKAKDFLAGGSKRDFSGNVLSKTKQKTTTPIGTPKYISQLAGRWERMQNRMKQAGGMIQKANKGSAGVKNPVADGLKGMLKMMAGASIVGLIGKKLFDSSPMLQAMMKLFNTSVMLIFRPIGDFIGGFLRPLMLFFMKNIAIPFYKSAKGLGSIGESYGKQALGFLLKPMETIRAAIITGLSAVLPASMLGGTAAVLEAKTYSGVADWQLEQGVKSGAIDKGISEMFRTAIGQSGWDPWKGKISELYGVGSDNGMGMGTGVNEGSSSGKEIALITKENQIAEYKASLSGKALKEYNELVLYAEEISRDGEITANEMSLLEEKAREASRSGVEISKAFYMIEDNLHTVSNTLAARFRKIGLSLRTTEGGLTPEGKKYVKTAGVLTTVAGSELASTKEEQQAVAEKTVAVSDTQRRADKYYNMMIAKNKTVKEAIALTAKLFPNSSYNGGKYGVGSRYAGLSASGQKATDEGTYGQSKNDTTSEYRENYASDIKTGLNPAERIESNFTYEDPDYPGGRMITARDYKDGKLKKMKDYGIGGIINEEIFGVGRSGQRYRFGESGSEVITPMNKSGAVGTTININVGSITKEADFAKLKPLIQRWILEANSRRGIV